MKTKKNYNSIMSLDIMTQVVSMVIVTSIAVYAIALFTGQKPNLSLEGVVLLLAISVIIGRFICRLIVQKRWTPEEKQSVLEDTIVFNSRRNIRLLVKAGADINSINRWYIDNRANEKTKKLLAKLAK